MKTTRPVEWKRLVAGCLALGLTAVTAAAEAPADAARAALRAALETEQGFVKVHAAEVLATQGERAPAYALFLRELAVHGTEPGYRQGIRRTLALTAPTPADREKWIGLLDATVIDPASPDRLYAIESICKLGPPHAAAVRTAVAQWLLTAPVEEAGFLHWMQAQDGDPAGWKAVAAQLNAPVLNARLRAAHILRRIESKDPVALAALARAADAEPAGSAARAFVVGSAYRLRADPSRLAAWRAILDQLVAEGAPVDRYEALQCLMPFYGPADLPALLALLRHPHGDVRIGAAWAILTISGR